MNIDGKNYNTSILAVDNMPVIKKYLEQTYSNDLKTAIPQQLKKMYEKNPERFKKLKEEIKQKWKQQLKDKGFSDTIIAKVLPDTKLDPIVEEELLKQPIAKLSDTQLNNIFNKTLHVNITNNSHVAGQVLELTKMTLNDSLWEPRRHSDIHTLETSNNARIRLNTKDETLTVHNDYAGGAHFLFKQDLYHITQPSLIFDKNVTGESKVVLEQELGKINELKGKKLIEVKGTADATAFSFDREYKKGLYKLLLNHCENGFCLDVQKLAIPVATLALYSQQAQMANTLFALQLSDRNSDIFNRTLAHKSVWVRAIDGYSNQNVQGNVTPAESHQKGVQIGGDLFEWQNPNNQLSFGLMVGQAIQRSKLYRANTSITGDMKGYAMGAYATWQQLQNKQTGAYIDGWLQYQHFRHHLNDENSSERYKTKGWTASLEVGYNALLAEHFTKKGNRVGFYLQPQVQLIRFGVDGHFIDSNDTNVTLLGTHQWQSRVGVQAKLPVTFTNDITLQPFVTFNVIHQAKNFGVEMDGERRVVDNKTTLEGQIGVAVKVKSHLTLQASFNRQTGKNRQSRQGALNLQWAF
ncbi:autotransporter outer membrane beta-barrel domain-containing protein [Haemophilus haemolyticus]|uniref:autotransporter outer membrane beta-barrel domain-containing protein n=1 Tax=Haemophilus haemolyticus TaxID=726 RepID=UPI0023AA6DC5|nr:autotransporter outer membrane beta-barrel domain-containing protein [Haemophilus haemolyticus]